MKIISKDLSKNRKILRKDTGFLSCILKKYYTIQSNYIGYIQLTHRLNPELEHFEEVAYKINLQLQWLNNENNYILTNQQHQISNLKAIESKNIFHKHLKGRNNQVLSQIFKNHVNSYHTIKKNSGIDFTQNKNTFKSILEDKKKSIRNLQGTSIHKHQKKYEALKYIERIDRQWNHVDLKGNQKNIFIRDTEIEKWIVESEKEFQVIEKNTIYQGKELYLKNLQDNITNTVVLKKNFENSTRSLKVESFNLLSMTNKKNHIHHVRNIKNIVPMFGEMIIMNQPHLQVHEKNINLHYQNDVFEELPNFENTSISDYWIFNKNINNKENHELFKQRLNALIHSVLQQNFSNKYKDIKNYNINDFISFKYNFFKNSRNMLLEKNNDLSKYLFFSHLNVKNTLLRRNHSFISKKKSFGNFLMQKRELWKFFSNPLRISNFEENIIKNNHSRNEYFKSIQLLDFKDSKILKNNDQINNLKLFNDEIYKIKNRDIWNRLDGKEENFIQEQNEWLKQSIGNYIKNIFQRNEEIIYKKLLKNDFKYSSFFKQAFLKYKNTRNSLFENSKSMILKEKDSLFSYIQKENKKSSFSDYLGFLDSKENSIKNSKILSSYFKYIRLSDSKGYKTLKNKTVVENVLKDFISFKYNLFLEKNIRNSIFENSHFFALKKNDFMGEQNHLMKWAILNNIEANNNLRINEIYNIKELKQDLFNLMNQIDKKTSQYNLQENKIDPTSLLKDAKGYLLDVFNQNHVKSMMQRQHQRINKKIITENFKQFISLKDDLFFNKNNINIIFKSRNPVIPRENAFVFSIIQNNTAIEDVLRINEICNIRSLKKLNHKKSYEKRFTQDLKDCISLEDDFLFNESIEKFFIERNNLFDINRNDALFLNKNMKNISLEGNNSFTLNRNAFIFSFKKRNSLNRFIEDSEVLNLKENILRNHHYSNRDVKDFKFLNTKDEKIVRSNKAIKKIKLFNEKNYRAYKEYIWKKLRKNFHIRKNHFIEGWIQNNTSIDYDLKINEIDHSKTFKTFNPYVFNWMNQRDIEFNDHTLNTIKTYQIRQLKNPKEYLLNLFHQKHEKSILQRIHQKRSNKKIFKQDTTHFSALKYHFLSSENIENNLFQNKNSYMSQWSAFIVSLIQKREERIKVSNMHDKMIFKNSTNHLLKAFDKNEESSILQHQNNSFALLEKIEPYGQTGNMVYKENIQRQDDRIEKVTKEQSKLRKMIEEEIKTIKTKKTEEINMVKLSDQVYKNIEKKFTRERQRRGMI